MGQLLSFTSNKQIDAQNQAASAAVQAPGKLVSASQLSSFVKHCFTEAQTAKDLHVTGRLLDCLRRRNGEYEPAKLAEIREYGGSEVFLKITDTKARAAEAWINDVLLPHADEPFTLEPTPIPEINPELAALVQQTVQMEAQLIAAAGMPVSPKAIMMRGSELYDELQQQINKQAKLAADRHKNKIKDQMVEGGWRSSFKEFVTDFVTYPTAFLKGPIMRPKKVLEWGNGWVPRVITKSVMTWYRLSPFDAYPAAGMASIDSGYFIERRYFNRADLVSMIGQPGYSKEDVTQVLDHYGSTGLRNWMSHDSERYRLEERQTSVMTPTYTIEGLEYSGPVWGAMLQEWGMANVNRYEDYEASIIVIGPYVIRAMLNPDPLGRRAYRCASFESVPGSIWGNAIAEIMDDVQDSANAAGRALNNNIGIASGPQVDIAADRLAPGFTNLTLRPWKRWLTTSDRSSQSGQGPIRFYQPEMHAQQLAGIIEFWEARADDRTAIPRYAMGSDKAKGAAETASGLDQLLGNAAKGIKQAIFNADIGVIEPVVEQLYHYNMLNDPDQSIKADLQVKARGAAALIVRQVTQQRRAEFLDKTNNPTDLKIMGIEGRAQLLREQAKTLDMTTNEIVPSNDEIQRRLFQEQQAQLAMQQQGTAGEGPPPNEGKAAA